MALDIHRRYRSELMSKTSFGRGDTLVALPDFGRPSMDLDLRKLRYFVAVAKHLLVHTGVHGSIAAAT